MRQVEKHRVQPSNDPKSSTKVIIRMIYWTAIGQPCHLLLAVEHKHSLQFISALLSINAVRAVSGIPTCVCTVLKSLTYVVSTMQTQRYIYACKLQLFPRLSEPSVNL